MSSDESQDLVKEKPQMGYVVITPVRNEAEFIEKTLDSMCCQKMKPAEWIIVNDGSTDDTAQIVAVYAAKHPWIKLVNRQDRGRRQRGKGVVEAFYDGYKHLGTDDYGVIVKLDGDLSFEPGYFAFLLDAFETNPKLGIAGGGVYERLDGKDWKLRAVRDHVRGPTKLYRRTCFEAIGGLTPTLGWDGLDEWQAMTLGWHVESFLDQKVLHYRYTGAATGSIKSWVEQGQGAYYMCYYPLFLVARGIRHMFSRPYFIGGLAMTVAYFWAAIRQQEKLTDPAVIAYIRRTQKKQLRGLLSGRLVHQRD